MAKKRIGKVKVIPEGRKFRVVERDESLAGTDRAPADGGGFDDERSAQALAATINARRARRDEG